MNLHYTIEDYFATDAPTRRNIDDILASYGIEDAVEIKITAKRAEFVVLDRDPITGNFYIDEKTHKPARRTIRRSKR